MPSKASEAPSVSDVFAAENAFYHHCSADRISKFLSHAKLYEMSLGLPGHFVEAGVFRGASFCRFRKLGRLFHPDHERRFIGFDVFGRFPAAGFKQDRKALSAQFSSDGDMGVSREWLQSLLESQGLAGNVDLVAGDLRKTMPRFFADHPEMSLALVNIDVDLYEPTAAALKHLFPRVVRGGVVILDDYEGFPGAKKAVDEYLARNRRPEKIRKFPFAYTPCYIVKEAP